MKVIKRIPQMALGLALIFAGFGHLGPNRLEFQAQVPNLFKDYADQVVLISKLFTETINQTMCAK